MPCTFVVNIGEVKPLPQFASRDGKQRPALRAGEHLFAQTARTFADLRDRVKAGELVLPDGSLEIGQFEQQALQKRAQSSVVSAACLS